MQTGGHQVINFSGRVRLESGARYPLQSRAALELNKLELSRMKPTSTMMLLLGTLQVFMALFLRL